MPQRAARAAMDRLNRRVRLAAGVAHEVHTPVGVLRSGIDTLARVLKRCDEALIGGASESAEVARARRGIERSRQLRTTMDDATGRISQVTSALAHFAAAPRSARAHERPRGTR